MNFDQNPNDGSGSKNLLKLKSGESIVGVFRGDIKSFHMKWIGKKSKICHESDVGAKFRFRVNFIVNNNGTLEARIWEQGAKTYNFLKMMNEDFPLETTFVKIARQGSDTNTTYTIMPIPKGSEVTPEKQEMLKQIALNDLTIASVEPESEGMQSFPSDDAQSFQHDEIPF